MEIIKLQGNPTLENFSLLILFETILHHFLYVNNITSTILNTVDAIKSVWDLNGV
jgi:hypothetical protein